MSVGIHLIMDVITKDIKKICSEKHILDYINKCIKISGMEKLDRINLHKLPVDNSNLVGITAIVPLSTSHMSIHTWPELNYISIDLFSCKYFEVRDIVDYTKRYFDTSRIDIKEIERHIGKPQKSYQWTEV